MKIFPFKAVLPRVNLITSAETFFADIKYKYKEYHSSGFFDKIETPSFYILEIMQQERTFTGVVCATDIGELRAGNIRKHEETLPSKEQEVIHLLLERRAMVKPVLLAYPDHHEMGGLIQQVKESSKPSTVVIFADENEKHTVWPVRNAEMIQRMTHILGQVGRSYIADGHHRCSTVAVLNNSKYTGVAGEDFSRVMTAYFPYSELQISDYNRACELPDGMKISELIAHLSQFCKIRVLSAPRKPLRKYEWSLYGDKVWFRMRWKKKYIQPMEGTGVALDSDLLNKHLFDTFIDPGNSKNNARMTFLNGEMALADIERVVNKMKNGLGICIFPVRIEEMVAIADQDKTLPPKSTWFKPRLMSGIINMELSGS